MPHGTEVSTQESKWLESGWNANKDHWSGQVVLACKVVVTVHSWKVLNIKFSFSFENFWAHLTNVVFGWVDFQLHPLDGNKNFPWLSLKMKFFVKMFFFHGKKIFCFNKMFSAQDVFQSHKKYFLCHKNILVPRKNLGSVSHFFKNSGKSPIGLMMLLFNLVNKMRCWTKEIWKGQGLNEVQRNEQCWERRRGEGNLENP